MAVTFLKYLALRKQNYLALVFTGTPEAPAPSWIGATRSDPGVGQEDMLSSPSEGRAEALINATFIVDARRVDRDVDSTSSADAH